MAKHVFVRPARKEDEKQFVEWTIGTKDNLFDSGVLKYPSTVTRCAFSKNGPIVFMPLQRPLFMEWLAINPNADKFEVAAALKELTQDAVSQAYEKGAGEVYFLCQEETTQRFAENQVFEKIPWNLYRIKLSDLEKIDGPKNETNLEKPSLLE